jgi:hypothetical protein
MYTLAFHWLACTTHVDKDQLKSTASFHLGYMGFANSDT